MFKSFDFFRSLYAIVITPIFVVKYSMRGVYGIALHIFAFLSNHEMVRIIRLVELSRHLPRQNWFGGVKNLGIVWNSPPKRVEAAEKVA